MWNKMQSGTTENNAKHVGLLPALLKSFFFFSRWALLQTTRCEQARVIHTPSCLARSGTEAPACLLGTLSPQICDFPDPQQVGKEAQGPSRVAPASPHLTTSLVAHPLSQVLQVSRCSNTTGCCSQDSSHRTLTFILTGSSHGILIFIPDLSGTFLWSHNNTSCF